MASENEVFIIIIFLYNHLGAFRPKKVKFNKSKSCNNKSRNKRSSLTTYTEVKVFWGRAQLMRMRHNHITIFTRRRRMLAFVNVQFIYYIRVSLMKIRCIEKKTQNVRCSTWIPQAMATTRHIISTQPVIKSNEFQFQFTNSISFKRRRIYTH